MIDLMVDVRGAARVAVWLGSPEAGQLFDAGRLSQSDRKRLSELRGEHRRREFAVSRALRETALNGSSDPCSLSHSQGWAAVARGSEGCSLGVDLEFHRARNMLGIARFAFDPAEIAVLERLDAQRLTVVFYALWTMKESMAKALAVPLLVAAKQCVFLPPASPAGNWQGSAPTDQPWMVRAFRPRPDMALSVAVIGSVPASVATCEWPVTNHREWAGEWASEWEIVATIVGPSAGPDA